MLFRSVWERTGDYGSLMISVSLTPAGQQQHSRVLGALMSYLEHLRTSPFPAGFHRELARIGALNETYRDRGEGAALAVKLANQALFYPLEVAERATDAWGEPDEAAYRRLLAALTQHAGQVLSRQQLLTMVWGSAYEVTDDQVKTYIGYLRRKIGDADRKSTRLNSSHT